MRLDLALVAAGLAASRTKAQVLIAEGVVLIDGAVGTRPASAVREGALLELTGEPFRYVSRAALKLKHAIARFDLDVYGAVALDLGASTGGFSQVLLEAGAEEVWAVDVGHGQLAPVLRDDVRLHLKEGLNARTLAPTDVPPPDWIVADLSFISLAKALPPALAMARPGAHLVALIKPQFEVGPALVGKGGIVRDPAAHRLACARVRDFVLETGWAVIGETASPILGSDGNREFLIVARKPLL